MFVFPIARFQPRLVSVTFLDLVTFVSPGLGDVPADDVLDEAALLLHHLLARRLSAH